MMMPTLQPTPQSPYNNRLVTLGRLPAMAPNPLQPQTQQPPTFAQSLARQTVPGANGGFSFRRPTGPVSMAAANHRTRAMSSSTGNRFSGTAFGGYTGSQTTGSVGSMGRITTKLGMG